MIYHTEIPNSSFDMISITYSLRHTKNAPNLFFINRIFCISETGICIEIISTIPEASWIPRCWVNTKNYKAVFQNSNLVFQKPYLHWNLLSGHWLLFCNEVFCFYIKGHWFSIWEILKTQIHEKYWFSLVFMKKLLISLKFPNIQIHISNNLSAKFFQTCTLYQCISYLCTFCVAQKLENQNLKFPLIFKNDLPK